MAITESAFDKAEREKWEAQQDVRTLRDAQEISKDPERLKRAKKMIEQEIEALEQTKA